MRSTLLLPLFALAACAHTRVAEVTASPPAPVVEVPPPPPLSPISAGLSAAGATWHLRAGLNVAALGCRGVEGDAIVRRYNALLAERETELAAARVAIEAEDGGIDGQARHDEAMTRLYNFFSGVPDHARFCAAANAVLTDLEAVPPGGLAAFAQARLPDLDAPFARPVTIAAASSAPRFVAGSALPAPRLHLSVDVSALPPD